MDGPSSSYVGSTSWNFESLVDLFYTADGIRQLKAVRVGFLAIACRTKNELDHADGGARGGDSTEGFADEEIGDSRNGKDFNEAKSIRENVKKLKISAENAPSEGGSSYNTMCEFVKNICTS